MCCENTGTKDILLFYKQAARLEVRIPTISNNKELGFIFCKPMKSWLHQLSTNEKTVYKHPYSMRRRLRNEPVIARNESML